MDQEIGLEATLFDEHIKKFGKEKLSEIIAETLHQLASTVLHKTMEHIETKDLGEIEYEETRSNETG